jgi:predicted DCC family thiol-disulfide oxidoreductase YuxK
MQENIVFFDGFCNFCSSSVLFILKRDRKSRFHFAAIQSDFSSENLSIEFGAKPKEDSLILYARRRYYRFSTAALHIARQLVFPWNLLYVFIIIPSFLRDPAYKWFAARRYKWFGKRESCFIPDKKYKARFLSE